MVFAPFWPVWVLVFISKRDWYQSLCGFETELITLSLSRSCVYHPKSNLFGHFLSGKLCPKSDNFIYKYYLNVKCMKVKKVKCMKLEWSIGWLSLDTIYHGLLRTVPLWKEGLLPISIFRSFYIKVPFRAPKNSLNVRVPVLNSTSVDFSDLFLLQLMTRGREPYVVIVVPSHSSLILLPTNV